MIKQTQIIPFVLAMAIQERGHKGKQTGKHWRVKFRDYLNTQAGRKWFKEIRLKEDKNYIKVMLQEIKK